MPTPFAPRLATPRRVGLICHARRLGALGALALAVASPAAWSAAAVPRHLDAITRTRIVDEMSHGQSFENRYAAEVWLVDMSHRLAPRVPNVGRRLSLLRDVHAAATSAGLSPQLVLAVIQVESDFKRFALSPAGARGLMQVMPFWRHEIGKPGDNLFARRTNLRYGCAILAGYIKREHGNVTRALARYNGSLGQFWYPARVERALRANWSVP